MDPPRTYAVLENDYALILGQLASVRMRAAARPRQHSRFDSLGGGSSLVLAGSTSQLDEAFENVPQNICAPPSEFSTDAEYSLRSMDKAIATIDRMRQCHKEKGLISIRVLVFSEVIRTYMASPCTMSSHCRHSSRPKQRRSWQMADFDANQVVADMLGAARGVARDDWHNIQGFAQERFTRLINASKMVAVSLVAREIEADEAAAMIAGLQAAAREVFLTVRDVARNTLIKAWNAAVAVFHGALADAFGLVMPV